MVHQETPETLTPLQIVKRCVGPKFPEGATFDPTTSNSEEHSIAMKEYHTGLLVRAVGGNGKEHRFRGFGQFIPATGTQPE